MAITISHAGDLGDLILGLSAIRQYAGDEKVKLILYPHEGVRDPMTPSKVALLRPFFLEQPFIEEVVYQDVREELVCDFWRNGWIANVSIADAHAKYLKVVPWPHDTPWLQVSSPRQEAEVIIARSTRYHGFFDYKPVAEKYAGRMAFVGTEAEWVLWKLKFGNIPRIDTPTILDLARVIAGARICVMNQSLPCCLAMGLGFGLGDKWIVQETDFTAANVIFHRPKAIYSGFTLQALPLPD